MQGILFASFGTTHDNARQRDIEPSAQAVFEAFPDAMHAQAFTSSIVRRRLAARGVEIPDTPTALERMADAGVTEVVIQPGHLLPGKEYDKLLREAATQRERFDSMRVGEPLLAVPDDLTEFVRIVCDTFPSQQGRAVVLMGHGSPSFSDAIYAALDYRFKEHGRADIFVGTVDGYPTLETVMRMLDNRFEGALLAPLMLVAGDHATNDMAGAMEDSWASAFKNAGYQVDCHFEGLGCLPHIHRLFVEHARAARELSLTLGAAR